MTAWFYRDVLGAPSNPRLDAPAGVTSLRVAPLSP